VLTRERFASILEPYIFKVYETVIEKGEDYASTLFAVNTSKMKSETVTGMGAADLPRAWNGQVHYGDIDPLYDKTFTHAKYSTGIKFDRDLWDDALYAEAKNRVNRVILAVHRFRQLHAHSLLNNAFSTTGTVNGEAVNTVGPDLRALCATDHPYSAANATTQSNKGTAPLSVQALEDARVAMMNFTDDKGQKLLIVPDTLYVPPALDMLAHEIVNSVGRSDTADRADNVRRGAYKVVTLPLLSDSNNWFLVDSSKAKEYCLWFDRRKPIPEKEEDFDTEVIKHKMVMRFSYGFIHWCWIYGSEVA
jgi:hypothetical protein